MGSILSRRIAGVEDIDIQANSAYRYPPKSGNYFTSHFFMGGEKFDTPHPEGYLFGENMDLNFLGNRPVQFPYVTPAPNEPVKTLRSLVNIRKDTLRLVRYKDDSDSTLEDTEDPRVLYSVEFCFDTDARVAITLYCQAFEEFANGMAIYSPKSPSLVSETVHYKRGINQQFSLPSFKIDFTKWKPEELNFDLDKGVFPLVVQAIVDDGDDVTGHAHVLLAAFERVDRVSYLLQEIYGIENRNNQETKSTEDENSDNSSECVNADNIPPGYEPISLLEALNGVQPVSPSIPSAPLYEEIQFSGEMGDPLNLTGRQQNADTTSMKGKGSKSPDGSTRSPSSPIQEEEDEERMSELSDAQPQSVLSCSLSPTEATVEGGSTKPGFPNSGSESRSLGVSVSEILQDCHSERSSLSRTESDPSADLALPGSSESIESLKSQSTSSSSQPLLCLPSTLSMEDERLPS
ncbi:hypothetical protein cypCar_00008215 [Cyprinus carpio]|nr:hypothetical protein cypCar_00008215 [Cyprinus carpio]